MKKNEQPDCSFFLYIIDNLQQKNKNNVVATTSIEKIDAILKKGFTHFREIVVDFL